MTLYEKLNLSREATQDDIKKAYKKLAMKFHPDKCRDDKEKTVNEAKFKEVNEAYSVLSDPVKRARYDQFGTYDDTSMGPGMNGMNMDDLFKDIFGGGNGFGIPPMGGPGGSFSFVFMDGVGNVQQHNKIDTIDIHIDINDIFYGETKTVEFEMLEQCHNCQGTGAQDPSHVLRCLTCSGSGIIQQQMGPFFMQSRSCPSCAGQGTTVQHNKHCQKCKGSKTIYNKRKFELKLPKGIPDRYEVVMNGKGAYNQQSMRNNDIRFRFIYKISEPYTIDANNNVHYRIKLHLEELLGGFSRNLTIYREQIKLTSEHYFNPNKTLVLHGMGIYDMKAEKPRDLHIHFEVLYQDNERYRKYADVLKKVLKLKPRQDEDDTSTTTGNHQHIDINQFL